LTAGTKPQLGPNTMIISTSTDDRRYLHWHRLTENWNKTEFQAFAKLFDKGKAWNFTVLENTFILTRLKVYWFDELLNTQMKICRGSEYW
jgi:hypothetical protein